ncbi:hypothetical protein [Streptomyces roseoverticillatus]|uniref:hypothetical protein n=1 Tax=Streptomyces roseoverticillatus TaxID=66429 RepID=UPI0004C10EA1|nr:hypothetical protein [Streptomyces roseoverticillatus]
MRSRTLVGLAAFGAVAVLTALVVLLSPPAGSAEPGDVIGSWRSHQAGALTLRADGTFIAVRVPTAFAADDERPTAWFTGRGTWSLKRKPKLGHQRIRIENEAGETYEVSIAGEGARDGLFIKPPGDTATQFRFKKTL